MKAFAQDEMILSVRRRDDMPVPECQCGIPYGVRVAVWDSSRPKVVHLFVFDRTPQNLSWPTEPLGIKIHRLGQHLY